MTSPSPSPFSLSARSPANLATVKIVAANLLVWSTADGALRGSFHQRA
jgi:translation initiation factor 2A